jgi:two-component system sensor histidine kinase HydH
MSLTNLSGTGQSKNGLTVANELLESLVSSVIVIEGDRVVNSAGEFEKMVGFGCSESPQTIQDLPSLLQKIIRASQTSGQPILDKQLDLAKDQTTQLRLCVSVVPIQRADGPSAVVVFAQDLTSATEVEHDLRRLNRLASLGTLSASMAHEIKNALVASKTFVDLLVERNPSAELADVVQRELKRIDGIVTQMLRFSGPARPALAAVHLHEVLDHSLRLVQAQIKGKAIHLTRTFRASPDLINGDSYQLQQAIVNLLLNGLEAMGPNGKLSVATELVSNDPDAALHDGAARPAQIRITITDSGAGIPQENISRLFEPFFTTKQHGTGLGLPITQRIIQEHGGVMSVESQTNLGTAFSILLPALI